MSADTPEALSAAFGAAMNAGDVQAALELWIEDAAILQPGGQMVRGREAIGAALRALIEHEVQLEIDVEQVFAAGDVAVAVGTLTMSTRGEDGEPFTQSSRSAVISSRGSDGRWRLAIDAPWGLPSA
jgi:uncharacterized protein (TIGR02246 family)